MNPTPLDTLIPELIHASHRTLGTRRRTQAPNLPRRRSSTEGHPRPAQSLRATALPGDPTAMGVALALHDDSRHHESSLLAALAGEETYRRAPGDSSTIAALRGVQQLLHIAADEGCGDPAVAAAQQWLDRTTAEVSELLDHADPRPLTPLRCVCTRRYTLPASWRTDVEPSISCPCGRSMSYSQWSRALPVLADLRSAAAIESELGLSPTDVHRLHAQGLIQPKDQASGVQLFSLGDVQAVLADRAAQAQAAAAAVADQQAERVARVRAALAQGSSQAEIASAEGVATRTLRRWLAV